MQELINIIEKGGAVMWPIAFCAFVTVVILIERYLYFRVTHVRYDIFRDCLVQKISKNELSEIDFRREYVPADPAEGVVSRAVTPFKNACRKFSVLVWNASPFTKIASEYSANAKVGEKTRNEALMRTGSLEIEKMEKHFKILSAISTIAPLLGLLGTVIGILESFQTIQRMGGQVDVNSLAGGIWVALLTTVAGLIVAIPAQLGYIYFDKKVTERSNRMNYVTTYLNEKLFAQSESSYSSSGVVSSVQQNDFEQRLV